MSAAISFRDPAGFCIGLNGHILRVVGPEHVGIGTDYVFDNDDLNRELADNPHVFPESYRRWGRMDFFPPEQLVPLEAELARLGYPQSAIEGIMGGNFLRVAEQVWRPRHAPPSAGPG